jgi:uncharacterized protein YjbI with pentapeptide repeats
MIESMFKKSNRVLYILAILAASIIQPYYIAAQVKSEQQQLIEKQMANEEAQAEYYRVQTAKLLESPKPKTFWQSVTENPASMLGVLGATLAAIVALISFLFNYRATKENQKDTQFYEALKRFGDKDSPAARSSASGLLAQMSQRKSLFRRKHQYFKTSFNQLSSGLYLEENIIVLSSITESIQQIAPLDPDFSVQRLYEQNLKLQESLLERLSDFFVLNGANPKNIDSKFWDSSMTVTNFSPSILQSLVEQNEERKRFTKFMEASSLILPTLQAEQQAEHSKAAITNLRITSERLRANVQALATALRVLKLEGPPSSILKFAKLTGVSKNEYMSFPSLRLNNVFLVGADISDSILNNVHLRRAKLQNVKLTAAKLKNANLHSAHLEDAEMEVVNLSEADLADIKLNGADLSLANLRNAKLFGADLQPSENIGTKEFKATVLIQAKLEGADLRTAKLDEVLIKGASIDNTTDIGAANWWKANFSKRFRYSDDTEPDTKLLEKIYELEGGKLSAHQSQVHPSVLSFIEKRNKGAQSA